jgi:hypothetical protein
VPSAAAGPSFFFGLRVNATGRAMQRLVQEFIGPLESKGRCVTPAFADWIEAAAIVTAIVERDRRWRPKLPALLDDTLIALCARRIGATLFTYNAKDFRLIRRHKEFALRVLAADAA